MTPAAGAALAQAIADATGAPFLKPDIEPVAGGCIHEAVRASGDAPGGRIDYFAKLNEADRSELFVAEAAGLRELERAGALRVPRVVAQGRDDEHAWIVLEWLDLVPLDSIGGALLGASLAALHRVPQQRYGWDAGNFIGRTPQANDRSDDWIDFWRSHRLHPQLRLAARNRLPSRMIGRGERLLSDCHVLLQGHAPSRSLLHGDLWGGNAAALADGTPVVFDPAVYVGDREADLAMTELFGGFPKDFHAAYRNAWPLADGYPVRRDFYNLYHVLNHANLFMGDYVRQSEHAIEKLLAEM